MLQLGLFLVLCCSVVPAHLAVPQPRQGGDVSDVDAASYLRKFGYIDFQFDPSSADTHSDMASVELYTNAIKNFQSFARLPITGELDHHTKETMKLPRCGLKDDPPDPDLNFGTSASETPAAAAAPLPAAAPASRQAPFPPGIHKKPHHHHRNKRHVEQGSKWPSMTVTYTVVQYTESLSNGEVDAAIAKALGIWEANSGLRFQRVSSGDSANIVIKFARRAHGDNDPFDGPGGVLAHAYYPVYGGALHFDDDEKWGTTLESSYENRKSLVQVALHEAGHSLGLGHSDKQSAIMAPFYRSFQEHPKLDDDDIAGIQYLYGPPGSRKPDRQPDTTQPDEPSRGGGGGGSAGFDICREKLGGRNKIDAITTVKDGSTYAFSGQYYWKIGDVGVESGYPRLISQDWSGLPNNVDAAVTWREQGRTYFFKGDQYWRFSNQRPEPNYPKRMSLGFPGIPTPVSAAFVWSGNGKLYFIKGSQYWQFITDGPETADPIPAGYPRPVSTWLGVQEPIDAAFEWRNGKTYFFSGSEYTGFDDAEFKVDESKYPRDTLKYWFGCQSQNQIVYGDAVPTGGAMRQSGQLVMAPANLLESARKSYVLPVIGPAQGFNKPLVAVQHSTMRFVSRRKQVLQQQNDAAQSATEDPNRVRERAVPKSQQPHTNSTLTQRHI